MFSRMTRNFFWFSFWFILIWVFLGITGVIMLANYMGFESGLELQGYEKKILGEEELLGKYFSSFFPEATLAHLFAFGVTCGLAVFSFVLVHHLFLAYNQNSDRLYLLRTGQTEQARMAEPLIWRHIMFSLALVVPLFLLFRWDLDNFVYRGLAGIKGLNKPLEAVNGILSWNGSPAETSHFAESMATSSAPWGYLGLTFGLSIVIEIALHKAESFWAQLCAPLDELWESQTSPGVEPSGRSGNQATRTEDSNASSRDYAETNNSVPSPENMDEIPESPRQNPGSPAPNLGVEPEVVNQPHADHPVPVIGGQAGEEVLLSVALADTARYHVDPVSRQVWNREYFNLIHQDIPNPKKESL